MRKLTISISVEVEIWDKAAVIRQARERAKTDGVKLWRGFTAREAVQYLIDPGSLDGCMVVQSNIEEY